jgi:pyruvate ferredoxin oxidoreductase alpha subunit
MVNVDGFVLTHLTEAVEVPEVAQIKKFLPAYRPAEFLDTKQPLTFGPLVTPEHFFEIKQDQHRDLVDSGKVILTAGRDFKKVFGRPGNTLLEGYKLADAKIVLVSFGSVVSTMREAVDELRQVGLKVGILKVISFRPLPVVAIIKALSKAKAVAVVEKDLSLGGLGILATEIKAYAGAKIKAPISSFVVGLGGRDVTKEMIKKIAKQAPCAKTEQINFIGK